MDSIAGAKVLTERLLRRNRVRAVPDEPRPAVPAEAVPLFHWAGVLPPVPAEPPADRPRRWWAARTPRRRLDG
jgi:hypothetical protein